ncbi:MAG: hypothetical protein AB1813_00155 [Verrucomicrobiota bacterium]
MRSATRVADPTARLDQIQMIELTFDATGILNFEFCIPSSGSSLT